MRLLDDVEGRLAIDTHPGKGTTVTLRAPVPDAGGVSARGGEEAEASAGGAS
jgi:hypothetical protein